MCEPNEIGRRVPEIQVHPDEPNEPDDEQEEAPLRTGPREKAWR
jgi:hypothetical protein